MSVGLDLPSELAISETPRIDSPQTRRRLLGWTQVVLASVAIVGVLYFARDLIIPIVLALFLALLLRPVYRRMRRVGVPDVVASFLIVGFVAAVFLACMYSLIGQGQAWLAKSPEAIDRVRTMIAVRSGPIDDFAKATEAVRHLAQSNEGNAPLPVVVHSPETTYSILGTSGHIAGSAVIVFVLTFFLLSFSDTLLKQAVESQPSFSQKRNVVELLSKVESGISRYLGTITIINAALGLVTGLVLWMLGLPNPVLWGVMVGTLNYVPHVGAFVCLIVLFVVGAVTHQSLSYGLGVAAVFVLLTSAESYLVTPLVLSRSLQLSPLAVILFVLFWGWLWGIVGGLMAAPLLAVMKIICDQFESLRPWSIMLSGSTPARAT